MESGKTGAHLRHVHGILLLKTPADALGECPASGVTLLLSTLRASENAADHEDLPRAGAPYCVPTAPAAFRMGVQRATSLWTKLARASGERPGLSGITLPSSSRRLRVASSSSALTSVSLSFAMISLGVPLGANNAFQALTW